MVFKRCTIAGTDYSHPSATSTASAGSASNGHNRHNLGQHNASFTSNGAPARSASGAMNAPHSTAAALPVNPVLMEQLSTMDVQQLIERKDRKFVLHPQVRAILAI